MADVTTAPTMTAAQLGAAGTRLLGFYLGGGGVLVDALVDTADFVKKDALGRYVAGGVISAVVGSAAAPAFTFNDWEATGLFLADSHTLGFATNGAERMRLTGSNLDASVNIRLNNGTNRSIRLGSASNFHYDVAAVNDDFRVIAADGAQVLRINYPNYNLMGHADNVPNLGHPSLRWGTVFAGTGTINTCDVRFKTFRTDRQLLEAEHAAALALFDAFGFCQFNDAIETKGADRARWHFGPAAQEAYSIWADHGLCDPLIENHQGELVPPPGAIPPAFLCFDLIAEETAPVTEGWRPGNVLGPDGQPMMVKCAAGEEATEQRPTGETIVTREAGHIFGIRIDQMHSIMLAALNTERKAQAARIAALEAAA